MDKHTNIDLEKRIILLEQRQKQIEERYDKLFHSLGEVVKTNSEEVDICVKLIQSLLENSTKTNEMR